MPTKRDLVRLEYELTFATLFHCGSGIRTGLIDRSVVRDSAGYLYVPGSTFKGAVRENCEQLARFYEPRQEIASPHDAEKALASLGNVQPTMVMRIFGAQTTPGQLFFDDARLSEVAQKEYSRAQATEKQPERRVDRRDYKSLLVNEYTQVRLDRRTRTAVPGALYTSEFGTGNMTFGGAILGWLECTTIESATLRNERLPDMSPTYSLLLLLAGLRLVERLGGNKSSGKGQCQCKITKLQLNGHDVAPETWLSWLDNLDELAHYSTTGRDDA